MRVEEVPGSVQKPMDIQGIEPWTSRMRSVRATTVPNALIMSRLNINISSTFSRGAIFLIVVVPPDTVHDTVRGVGFKLRALPVVTYTEIRKTPKCTLPLLFN